MGQQDVQQVCLNGHQITDSFNSSPSSRRKFCPTCGEGTISACPQCIAPIRGYYLVEGFIDLSGRCEPVPSHCDGCGSAFPWAKASKQSAPQEIPWCLFHPEVVRVARTRFEAAHYADAVEAAFKEINVVVKRAWLAAGKSEKDGSDLMFAAFAHADPVVRLVSGSTLTDTSMQQGYMHLFAGSMLAIRNPKAHENVEIERDRGILFLALASLLMFKLDEAGCLTSHEKG